LDKLVTSIILSAADVEKEEYVDANADEEEDQPKPQQMQQGKQKVRGGALRELQQFYKEHNFNDFAGLMRVGLSNGEACWTTEAGKAILLDEEAAELQCRVGIIDEEEQQRGVLQEDEEDGNVMEEAFVASRRRRKRRFNEKEEEQEEYEVAGDCQIA